MDPIDDLQFDPAETDESDTRLSVAAWVIFVAYLVALIGFCVHLSTAEPKPQTTPVILLIYLPIPVFLLFHAHVTRHAISHRGVFISRDDSPLFYWILVAVYAFAALALAGKAFGALTGLW